MIPDIDIWRCAALMTRHYGDTADIDAAAKADALLAEGDTEGQRACPAESRGERWFCFEAEARAAGWRRSKS
jgi:hypothetical protein